MMKQTIKKMAIKFGKKVCGAIVSSVAMLIGECILSLITKGTKSFKAKRELMKQKTIAEAIAENANKPMEETKTFEETVETDSEKVDED